MTSKPQTLGLWWCDKCGQDDRWTSLQTHHMADGYRCLGTIRFLTYTLGGAA